VVAPHAGVGDRSDSLLTGGRPLKRWRYVGVFCEELLACAAIVQVGPARQCFWAIYLRAGTQRTSKEREPADRRRPREGGRHSAGQLRERTRTLLRRGAVELPAGHVRVRDAGVRLELALEETPGIQTRCTHGGPSCDPLAADGAALGAGEVWTRKQAGVRAHGSLALGGGPASEIEARAVIDDTVGYHARHTEWRWSAGVGRGPDGSALAWNLVQGVNDPPAGSERAVWVDGVPAEPPPVSFAADLSAVLAADGSRLCFAAEAQRRRRENLLIVRSDYTAPFGSFSGALPGGIALERGLGVMEHHRARW
jgi:Protein of unknown function (DUF2804)